MIKKRKSRRMYETSRRKRKRKRKLSVLVIPVITKAKERSKKLAAKGAYMYKGAQKKIISGVIRRGEKGEERERMIKAVP